MTLDSETGLALALSREFVELHGGRIWVTSQVAWARRSRSRSRSVAGNDLMRAVGCNYPHQTSHETSSANRRRRDEET
jgi:signal transduction histidine kinase